MATIVESSANTSGQRDITRRDLDVFFHPRSVAAIGATDREGQVGRTVLWNLISTPFGGTVYPVNPKRNSVLGIKAYPNVSSLPEPPELAVIMTPAETVPGIVEECARVGVRGAVVISAGFRESGPWGLELERQILRAARPAKMRVIGPNCLGVMCPVTGLNATFAQRIARPGSVAFVSQSGALCTAILDWSFREQIGFSAFISTGSMVDVGWGALIDYLGDDPHTRSIVIYMESVGDARSFLSAAREVALSKPIIVIKAGRTEQAAKAAASHTGSLAGSDEVLEAAFRRVGVLRVNSVSDIFYMTEVLANQPRPKGPKLAIITNAGGPGVLATDALLTLGGELAELSPSTLEALDRILPPHWSHNNPIDIIGDAGPERFEKAVGIVAQDPNADGLLVIMTPQGMTNPALIAEKLTRFAKLDQKPILTSWMGGTEAAQGEAILNRAGIPTFPFPDTAVRAFIYMWRYSYNLRGLYETPILTGSDAAEPQRAEAVIDAARNADRTILTEIESKQVLKAYGIPVVETRLAASENEAVAAAQAIGFPVVLKLNSLTITHKTDVGGVKLNLASETAVREAFRAIETAVGEKAGPEHFGGVSVQPMVLAEGYELILGSSIDSQFGPVLLFGTGGQLVEVFRDRALALPPLNTTLARRFIEQTKIFKALGGVRGRKPVDLAALEDLLVKFSRLVTEQRWIKEIDINPLLASPDRLIALDARVVVWGRETDRAELPRLAIRPYPIRYQNVVTLDDGTEIHIRPIRPEDEPLLVNFHRTLSERSVYLRYFHWMKLEQRTEHDRLTRMCFIDYDRQMAFVAECNDPATGERRIVGVGRLVKSHTSNEAELAVIVSDGYQRRGIGSEIVRQLVEFAREEKLDRITASTVFENRPMQKVFERVGFHLHQGAGGLPLVLQLARRLLAGEFGSDLLAGASIVTAVIMREYLVAAIVVLMLSGGTALEQYATRRASSVLNALAKRMPSVAHRSAGTQLADVSLDEIAIGDRLIVLPHEICPVDGTVLEGRGSMDESYLTGEPFLISKAPGTQVLSGAINGESALTISVGKLPVDSRYAKIMQVMRASEQNRPRLRRIADRLGAWYTPLALSVAALGGWLGGDPHRFLAVMVIATPCPLLLAIPIAIIGAISVAARGAIVIKNPGVLEQADRCRTLIFDKTGTLTYGRPLLIEILPAPDREADEVLRLAASLEQYSKHPLAAAILSAAESRHLVLESVRLISEKPGEGLSGVSDHCTVQITGRNRISRLEPAALADLPPASSGLECLVFIDGCYAALFRFRDEPRGESTAFVSHLKPKHAAQKVILLSGDRESEVRYLADTVGIGEVYAGKTPEEKVAIVREETRHAKTLYVGDGINDAPAMIEATVGVAFGQASDITAEAADAVLLEPSLAKVDELMHISRHMRKIALQSAVGGMALSILGMIAAAFGHLAPVTGAVAQEFIDLAAVLNALRVALPPSKKTDF